MRSAEAEGCAKLALGGPLIAPSSYFMKSPPVQFSDEQAHENTEAFIAGAPEDHLDWTLVLERSPKVASIRQSTGA